MAESEEKLKSLLMKVKEGSTWLKVEPHSSLSQASLINIRTRNSFVPPAPFLNLFIRVRSLVGLKLNIQKTKIMVSDPITSRQIDGEMVETVSDFIFLGSKITVDGDCSHETKRRLLLGRKIMTT